MSPSVAPGEIERFRLKVQAERERLRQSGIWEGSVRAHTDYQRKPLEWITTHLGVSEETLRWSLSPEYETHKWDGDADPIVKILDGIGAGKNVGVESATGTGKTFTAACITFWFLACFEDALVITVAPKETQLLKQLWKEIGYLWPHFKRHFPQAELFNGLVRMRAQDSDKEKWAALAFVCGVEVYISYFIYG